MYVHINKLLLNRKYLAKSTKATIHKIALLFKMTQRDINAYDFENAKQFENNFRHLKKLDHLFQEE